MPRNRTERPVGRSKYGAVRTNGYASKYEAEVAAKLQVLESRGIIRNLRMQVPFDLLPPDFQHKRALRYIADFVYDEVASDIVTVHVVADAKGFRTPVYKIKKRMMFQLLGIEVTEL